MPKLLGLYALPPANRAREETARPLDQMHRDRYGDAYRCGEYRGAERKQEYFAPGHRASHEEAQPAGMGNLALMTMILATQCCSHVTRWRVEP